VLGLYQVKAEPRCAPGTGRSASRARSRLTYLREHASQTLHPANPPAVEIETGASLYRNVAGCNVFQLETGA
jgi:hypothetical protein